MDYGLNHKYSLHILHGMLIKHGLNGVMNYTIWVWKYVSGGYSGDINAPWKMSPSILGIGILHSFGHSQHGCVSSASALCGGVNIWRLVVKEGTRLPLWFNSVVLFVQFGVQAYSSS